MGAVIIGPPRAPVTLARKMLKPSSPASAATIQKRSVIFSSAQPDELEVMVERRHAEDAPAAEAVAEHLEHHAHDHREEDDADDQPAAAAGR